MLAKLLKSRAERRGSSTTVPTGERYYAIGDVHGCEALLESLIARIDADDAARATAETTLLFLGDLIDRGPASAAVVERIRILAETRPRVRVLMGNHEEIFLRALAGDEKALRLFCRIGGRETILSYGMEPGDYDQLDYADLAAQLGALVPETHAAFIARFEDMIIAGDYAFVHAGVRPGVALADQSRRDLRWIRDPFLEHDRPLEKTIVHGHTIAGNVEFRRHRIGVDTGAYESGRLTALGLEGRDRWTIEAS